MATQEYLLRYIEAHKRYDELPTRLKLAVSEEEWCQKVKNYCINRGYPWAASPAAAVTPEHEYYDALLSYYRVRKRLFPYHLGDYICRFMRSTPFKYYRDILVDAMREDLPYDSIPNFTAADAVKVVGVGRNEYIATMVQAKSKKLLWRMNKGIVKDLLPPEPKSPDPEPWWRIQVVNLAEPEYRSLADSELAVCQAAASSTGGTSYAAHPPRVVAELHRRGLIWLTVPVGHDDQLSIPPLEGFVSNKTSATGSEDVDPMETLMYQLFVAASDRVTVHQLAGILNVELDLLAVAISTACRLKFCRNLTLSGDIVGEAAVSPSSAPNLGPGQGTIDTFGPTQNESIPTQAHAVDAMMSSPLSITDHILDNIHSHSEIHDAAAAAGGGGAAGGVALVVDAEVTGFLMMGALTPALKKHSVTLFEGGRVYGSEVIDELVEELHASVGMAQGFEGEMAALAGTAQALATVLDCVRTHAGRRPIELLRKESVESLPPSAAFRILRHSYDVVLPVAGLPAPPLPLSISRQGPINYGPIPAASTPWMHLALYMAAGCGPVSLVIPAGRRLGQLPGALCASEAALVWPWDAQAVKLKIGQPLVVPSTVLLFCVNQLLARTAVLMQPLDTNALWPAGDGGQLRPRWLDVPLPLRYTPAPNHSDAGVDCNEEEGACIALMGYNENRDGDGGANNTAEELHLPMACASALQTLGLSGAVGYLRVLQGSSGGWLPLSVCLGVPLQPESLCRAVCSHAAAARFLDAAESHKHNQGQKILHEALMNLARRHGGWSAGAGGVDADLSPVVPLPVHGIEVDRFGKPRGWTSCAALQGISLG